MNPLISRKIPHSGQRPIAILTLSLALLSCALIPSRADPPFSGTIFIDPDIITPTDPTSYQGVTVEGQGLRLMYDRRVNNWVNLNAYLFKASYDDGLIIEVQVNPEFGSSEKALAEATKYAEVIGRLPKTLRLRVATVWIHRGTQPFGGGNNNLLIHIGQADEYVADGILEETLVHEAAHTSLDALHASAPAWLNAQAADVEFISTYARDNPTREDVSESFLPYFAVRYRLGRISSNLANMITQTMPHRIAYFDQQPFDLHPQNYPLYLPFSGVTLDTGQVRLRWNSTPGTISRVLRSTDLETWQDFGAPISASGAESYADVLIEDNATQQYFRLREL